MSRYARATAIWLAGLTAIAACAGGGRSSETVTATPSTAIEIVEGDTIDVGTLPTQRLNPGECGLFLFTRNPTQRFVFYVNSNTATAKIRINGEVVSAARSAAGGDIFDQTYAAQTFSAPAYGLTMDLSLRAGADTQGGTRVDGGSLKLVRADGWSLVIPVAGATTCDNG